MTLNDYQTKVLDPISSAPFTLYVPNTLGPVLYFGRLKEAETVTISINPSFGEFLKNKTPLTGNKKRFESLTSLGRTDWKALNETEYAKILECCDEYFERNPYLKWFNPLEKNVLNYNNYSFFDNKVRQGYVRAAHLDLCCIATDPIWSDIQPSHQDQMLDAGLPVLAQLLTDSESPALKTIILNGDTTVRWFKKVSDCQLYLTDRKFITVSRKDKSTGKVTQIPVKEFYEGYISAIKLNGGEILPLKRKLKVVGWSIYIQNAYATVTPGPHKF